MTDVGVAILVHFVKDKGSCKDISCIGCPLSWPSVKREKHERTCTDDFVYSRSKELLLAEDPSSLFDLEL